MGTLDHHGSHGTNATYIYEFSRGLGGVLFRKDAIFNRILTVSLIVLAVVVFCGRIAQLGHAHFRQITSLTSSDRQQRFWGVETSSLWTNLKKHFLYAPLGRKRHNREIQLSSAANMGTIPSRFHAVLITLYVAAQIAYCSYLDYSVNSKEALMAELRGRSGTLAVVNMVPLFILAGRNNPLISLLHISFDTYNLLHRWLGRIVMLESVAHTIAWAYNAIDEQDFDHMLGRIRDVPFFQWGVLGTAGTMVLTMHSISPVRHAFYETFLHIHQLAAFLAWLGIYMHLKLDDLGPRTWALAAMMAWLVERSLRLFRLIYLNLSLRSGATKVVVEALPGEASRVTFHLPKLVPVAPGSHVYVYLPSISWWMSHPFSVAWVEPCASVTTFFQTPNSASPTKPDKLVDLNTPSSLEKQAILDLDEFISPTSTSTTITLIMAARQGMTRKLYNRALAAPARTLHTTAYLEGPYSSAPSTTGSYGTVVLFAAGAGITHHMLTVRDLLLRAGEDRVATRSIYLVWSVRTTEHLTWVQSYMNQILRLPNRRDILTVKLFVSKPRHPREIVSPSATVQMFAGRCRPAVVMDEVLPCRVGATLVSVCGPGAFADEVRDAARGPIGGGAVVDFVEEAFTW